VPDISPVDVFIYSPDGSAGETLHAIDLPSAVGVPVVEALLAQKL
jgi:hypothetical protein